MKTLIAIAVLSLSIFSTAHAENSVGGDQIHVDVVCKSTDGLTVIISSGGITGLTFAQITELLPNDGQREIANVAVRKLALPLPRNQGTLVRYIGETFQLDIQVLASAQPSSGVGYHAYPSRLYANIQGRPYNQSTACGFVAQAM